MKGLFIILFGCFVFTSFSQSRENRQKLSFKDSSEKLTSSTGWSYNETLGEWVNYDNVIEKDNRYKTTWESLNGEFMMSHKQQNFISIQTKSLIFNDEEFFVLLVKKVNGRYEYPSIREDWYTWEEVRGYVFNKIEYDKILEFDGEIKLKTKTSIDLEIPQFGDYDEPLLLDLIQTEMNKEKSKYSPEYTFPILKTTSDGSEVIRFYVPNYWSSTRSSSYDFDKEYFETTIPEFNKIIIR